jgi:outer membrane immunogenic protein
MKKFLLATVSMVALTTATRAADMASKAPGLAPAFVANWTGGYAGLQGGILRRDTSLEFSPNSGTDTATAGTAGNKTGGAFGGLLGYNWQQGRFVYGLEADWNWMSAKTTHFRPNFRSNSYDIDWLATARGRAGLAIDSTLFYLTGGMAFTRVKDNFGFLNGDSSVVSFTQDKTKVGWVVGAGVEHMFAPHWTARAEFRYVDLGTSDAACTPGLVPCNAFFPERAEFKNSVTMGLVGVNYTFGDNSSPGWGQARAYAPPPAPTWVGAYLGIQGGIARREASLADPDGFLREVPALVNQRKTGGTAGGLLGYNWQQGSFIYGAEGDWNWIGAKANRFESAFNGNNNTDLSTSFDVNWLATLRGRAGLALDSTLLYVTGGVALGHIKNRVELISLNTGVPDGAVASFSQNQTKVGWTAGVGAEHMLSQHWTARAEFRYVDLGKKEAPCTVTGAADFNGCVGIGYRGDFSNKLMLGLVGLAYKF